MKAELNQSKSPARRAKSAVRHEVKNHLTALMLLIDSLKYNLHKPDSNNLVITTLVDKLEKRLKRLMEYYQENG